VAEALHVRYVVLGGLERRTYPPQGIASVEHAGTVAFAAGGCRILEVP